MSSCDEEEPIPSYLYIPNFELITNSNGTQGTNTHNIVDAWVYVDENFLGVYELPTRVPVLQTGESRVTIVAGIKKNALATDRVPYPFFRPYEVTLDLKETIIDTIVPVVDYNPGLEFIWTEDFEDGTISLAKTGANSTVDSLKVTGQPNEVFDYDGDKNKFSGKVSIDTGFQIFEFSSVQLFDFPRSQDIYLEFEYKTEAELIAGIYPISGSIVTRVPIVNLFDTKGEWKKAYIALRTDVNAAEYQGLDFRVVFGSQTNSSVGKEIFLDNIKLMHF